MVSTVTDIAKFDVAMDRNLIISKELKETMYTPTISTSGKILPYGLGWFVQVYKGTKMVWHYGHWPKAYSSLILKIPEKELTMILLANSDGASRGFNLGICVINWPVMGGKPDAVAFMARGHIIPWYGCVRNDGENVTELLFT